MADRECFHPSELFAGIEDKGPAERRPKTQIKNPMSTTRPTSQGVTDENERRSDSDISSECTSNSQATRLVPPFFASYRFRRPHGWPPQRFAGRVRRGSRLSCQQPALKRTRRGNDEAEADYFLMRRSRAGPCGAQDRKSVV